MMASAEAQIDNDVKDNSSESDPERTEAIKARKERHEEAARKRQKRQQERDEKLDKIATDLSLTFAEKVDRLAGIRNWFRGHDEDTQSIIDKYLTGSLSVDAAVGQLATPIDHLYTTANEGRQYYKAEQVARSQRQYHSPEKALEQWGSEQEFPEPPKLPDGEFYPSCEGILWSLYYTFLHAAKRIDWSHNDQTLLIELMKGLKARPDPPMPEPMTIPLRREWVWGSGHLWSNMFMLGPAAREVWNDSPGCGSGWTDIEVKAWVNVNAFIARVTVTQVSDFRLYGLWAIRIPLEFGETGQANHHNAEYRTQMESNIMDVFVWIKLAGQCLWDRRVEDEPGYEAVTLTMRGEDLPWTKNQRNEISNARWKFWISRLGEVSNDEDLSRTTRDRCLEAASMMQEIAESTSLSDEKTVDKPIGDIYLDFDTD